jgi:hypothetical protein
VLAWTDCSCGGKGIQTIRSSKEYVVGAAEGCVAKRKCRNNTNTSWHKLLLQNACCTCGKV